MLFPQQLQRDPWPAQFTMNVGPVRLRPAILRCDSWRWEEQTLKSFVGLAVRKRPAESRTARTPKAFPGGRRAHPKAGGDLAFGQAGCGQPQHVVNFAHR